MTGLNRFFARLNLIAWLFLLNSLPAQEAASFKTKPHSHEANRETVHQAYETNLKKFADDKTILVRPGLVANKNLKRVEVAVERTAVGKNAPCEFTVIGETSEHGYEALLIAFAKPGDVQQALQFLGTEPGATYDPSSLRFWAKGETFILSVARSNEPPVRLEKLMMDRRTGKTLRESGFLFGGSRIEPSLKDPRKQVYVADEYQPKSIVSLFNATDSVLEVPYSARKEDVYQNTTINPDCDLPEGALLTLIIEAANKDGSKRVKDLVLRVEANLAAATSANAEALASLSVELKDAQTVLNGKPTMISAVESMATLDRAKHDYFLTVHFGNHVTLGQAQAVARVLAIIDSDKGVRVEPPAAGQIYYRAFTPDQKLLNREARVSHPWEISLSEKEGQVTGKLLLIDSVWKAGSSASELQSREVLISGPQDFRKELDAELDRSKTPGQRARPPVIIVFAPATLEHARLAGFLEPTLPTHKIVHLYLDTVMPVISPRK